ncbi:MAG: acyl-protein synthetase [Byssovorax sp.]
MHPSDESDALHARVQAFISASLDSRPTEPFDDLALAIARFQARHVPAIARLGRARAVDFDRAALAAEIPAVPTDVFRLARIAAHQASDDVALFRTSGSTQGKEARGEHPLRRTDTYAMGALAWGRRFLFPDRDRMRAIILAPPPAELPDSSLGFMLDLFARALGGAASYHLREGTLDTASVEAAATLARSAGDPVIVLATSFALVHLLEASPRGDLRLPEGSRAMQTGGFKGRSREVAPDELRREVSALFDMPESHVVAEYGMTELSSQLYEATLATALGHHDGPAHHGVYRAPPWMRVTAVDPGSLAPLPDGEAGLGRIVDLCNVDSAVAIQTADRVRVLPEGVALLGRAPGAVPRGCSIAIDEMLGRG